MYKILPFALQCRFKFILAALQAGADGYVVKSSGFEDLKTGIYSVLDGYFYLSPNISKTVINGYLKDRKMAAPDNLYENFIQREKEILKLVAEGF